MGELTDLSQQLSRLDPDNLTAVFTIGMMMCLGLVAVVAGVTAKTIEKYHTRQLAVTLIQDMLDRGMPAEDIVRILSAAGLEDMRHKMLRKIGNLVSEKSTSAGKS
jgi:hypothetical protein